ncbi:MAG: hypothetical protein H5T69_05020 [Chloroflexi bacterium]|nr:hypothetical protein [Chloroflexota bacterium]
MDRQDVKDRLAWLTDERVLAIIRATAQDQPGTGRKWAWVPHILRGLYRALGMDTGAVPDHLREQVQQRLQEVILAHQELTYEPGG